MIPWNSYRWAALARRAAALAAVLAVGLAAGCAAGTGRGAGPQAGAAAGSRGPAAVVASIQNTGSDTLLNLALAWAERYMVEHPDVRISVTGGGSGTGIASLINGTTQIANASREMSAEEVEQARKNGINPVRFTVALDAIAVVANLENPVSGLTIPQLSDMYTGKITRWSEVGGPSWPVVLLSRESNSGTYLYFLEQVVRRGNAKGKELFSPETLLMPSSQGISSEVQQNPNTIGYDGLGYVTAEQKTIAVARSANGPFVTPSVKTVLDKTYPISRPLFMYTAGEPTGAVKSYLDWVQGAGQKLVRDVGYVPLAEDGR